MVMRVVNDAIVFNFCPYNGILECYNSVTIQCLFENMMIKGSTRRDYSNAPNHKVIRPIARTLFDMVREKKIRRF